MTIINEESLLKQKYIREGLTPAAAYHKARAVMELRDELAEVPGYDHLSAGELLAAAEHEYQVGEDAVREYVEQVTPPARLTISRSDQGLWLQRGDRPGLLLSGREIAALLDQARRQLTATRKAAKARTITRRRQAEGRPTFAVIAGRKVA